MLRLEKRNFIHNIRLTTYFLFFVEPIHSPRHKPCGIARIFFFGLLFAGDTSGGVSRAKNQGLTALFLAKQKEH